MRQKLAILFFTLLVKFICAQEPSLQDKITHKTVIGFPGVTTEQLNLIKTEFSKYSQILSAKFIFDNHNCMLITFNPMGTQFTVYSEVLKTIYGYYDVSKCYIKRIEAFDYIENHHAAGSEFIVK